MNSLWQKREPSFWSLDVGVIPTGRHSALSMKPKLFENVETAANGTEISRKSFQKFWKLFNFRNANHSTENSRFSGSKVEWRENLRENFFEILGIPRKAALFLEILKNAVAFAPESWRKFEPDVSVEWKPLVETKMKNPSLVPRRFWIGHSWTLPWAVTSPRDTRRELKPITGSLARSLPHFARTKDQERTPKDKAGKTHCLFARFRSFAAYLRARQTKPPATQALDWPCTVHINSSSATFFSISPVIHNAS